MTHYLGTAALLQRFHELSGQQWLLREFLYETGTDPGLEVADSARDLVRILIFTPGILRQGMEKFPLRLHAMKMPS